MILIEESFGLTHRLVESTQQNGALFMEGVFGEAEEENRNRRVYDLQEMTKQVTAIQKRIKMGESIFGELDHPPTLDVKLANACQYITELYMDGNKMIGKARIMENAKGRELREIIESGGRPGVSTRGSGQLNESTGRVRNYNLVTVDAVATPSCRSAYPETLAEAKQYGVMLGESIDTTNHRAFREGTNAQLNDYVDFIKSLKP